MKSLTYKNPVLHQLDGHKGTGRQATINQLPDIHTMVEDKGKNVQSADPQPQWRETIPKGPQMWFTVAAVVVALAAGYALVKYKVIKL
jgi:hypothetical protein